MFKAGQILLFEKGTYSSWAYAGPFKVLRDFTKEDVVAAFKETTKGDSHAWYGEDKTFVAWLARNGFIEDTAVERWYLGDYSFEPFTWQESQEDARDEDDKFRGEDLFEQKAEAA
jgi:hypothetical protein